MAIIKLDWPAGTSPTLDTDYDKLIDILEAAVAGLSALALSNWDSGTTVPEVLAGSRFEVGGDIFVADADESIDASGASDGTVYLYFDLSAEAYVWLSTAPTWDAVKNGYYNGDDRFTGHTATYAAAGPTFSDKARYLDWDNGLVTTFPIGGWS